MDNRKVFRSYKEKVRDLSSPYITKPGLFSKVKQLFNASSIWSTHFKKPNERQNEETKIGQETVDKKTSEIKPFTFPEPDTSILKTPLKMKKASSTLKTPNRILSNFFQEKGDNPLTDVEYEGVVSLLSKTKSASNTPNNSVIIANDKSFQPNSHSTEHNQEGDLSTLKHSESNLFVTPYSQRTLKNYNVKEPTTIFSTPEFKPVYHTVKESFNSKNVPSVKRVYQFSGLPSPYRTRIRAPNVSTKPKKVIKTTPTTSSPTTSIQSKPMSETANTLLSILDGNTSMDHDDTMTGVSDQSSSNLKRFANPYPKPQALKKPKTKAEPIKGQSDTPSKRQHVLSAKDINKTLSFDKSEELPQRTAEIEGTPAKTSMAIDKQDSEPLVTKETSSNEINVDEKSAVPEKLPAAKSSNTHEAFPKSDQKPLFSFNQERSELNKPSQPPKSESKHIPPPSNKFVFGEITKPKEYISKENTLTEIKDKKLDKIKFPQVVQMSAVLDHEKVEKYKTLFEF